MKKILPLILTIYLLFPFISYADFNPETDVLVKLKEVKKLNINKIAVFIQFSVPENIHIVKNYLLDFKIPEDTGKIENIELPEPDKWKGENVYKGKFEVKVIIIINKNIQNLVISVSYQCCAEKESQMCYIPVSKNLYINLKKAAEEFSSPGKMPYSSSKEKFSFLSDKLKSTLDNNLFSAFLIVFIGGILASLTPCVYPIIPITIGYIGARSTGKKIKGFILSIFFVLGLSIIYAALGVAAGAAGSVFGSFTQTPLVMGFIALVFIIMGIGMFGAFDIQLPPSLAAKLQSKKQKGWFGAFIIGMITGLIAAPCVGPIIISLLAWIARTRSLFLGFWLLFVFAWGMGLLFILIGTFAGILNSLPKSGKWMVYIKYIFGFLLLSAGFYYLFLIVKLPYFYILAGITFILLVKFCSIESKILKYLIILLGVLSISMGGIAFTNIRMVKEEFKFQFTNNDNMAFKKAFKEKRHVFMDFYADWCIECKELEKKVYVKSEVSQILKNYITIKMDFTKKDKFTESRTRKYNIIGLPTVILFNYKGEEIGRFTGYMNAEKFMQFIQKE